MERVDQAKTVDKNSKNSSFENRFAIKERLNLNDLLQRRKNEKQIDKKTNLLIISGTTVVAATTILAILSF